MTKKKEKQKKIILKKKPSLLLSIVVGLALVLSLAFGIAIYFDQEQQMERIVNKHADLEKELDLAYIRNGELLALQEIVDTDEYAEKVAREQLGMVKPNELVFIDE